MNNLAYDVAGTQKVPDSPGLQEEVRSAQDLDEAGNLDADSSSYPATATVAGRKGLEGSQSCPY